MKWYDQILTTAKRWLNLGEDATEAEVHASMEAIEDLGALRAQIRTEAEAAVQEEVQRIQTENTALQSGVAELERQLSIVQKALETSQTRVTELENKAAAVHTVVVAEGGKTTSESPAWEATKAYIQSL